MSNAVGGDKVFVGILYGSEYVGSMTPDGRRLTWLCVTKRLSIVDMDQLGRYLDALE